MLNVSPDSNAGTNVMHKGKRAKLQAKPEKTAESVFAVIQYIGEEGMHRVPLTECLNDLTGSTWTIG